MSEMETFFNSNDLQDHLDIFKQNVFDDLATVAKVNIFIDMNYYAAR
jgi:hypothetical protein